MKIINIFKLIQVSVTVETIYSLQLLYISSYVHVEGYVAFHVTKALVSISRGDHHHVSEDTLDFIIIKSIPPDIPSQP